MPTISDQVAGLEADLEAALTERDSLKARLDATVKQLSAMTDDKLSTDDKHADALQLVEDVRAMANEMGAMALKLVQSARRPVAPANVEPAPLPIPPVKQAAEDAVAAAVAPREPTPDEITVQEQDAGNANALANQPDELPAEAENAPVRTTPLPPLVMRGGQLVVDEALTTVDRMRGHMHTDTAAGALAQRLEGAVGELKDDIPLFLKNAKNKVAGAAEKVFG